MKVRIGAAKTAGSCEKCRQPYQRGDRIAVEERTFHPACSPNAPGIHAFPVAQSAENRQLEALASLEAAVMATAKANGVTGQMEASFEKYKKLKGVALQGGSPNEKRMAMKLAIKTIVDIAF